MSFRRARALIVLGLVAGLGACAGTRPVARVDAPLPADPRDAARVAAVAADARWRFDGRIAVSDGQDSGSGRIRWDQDGAFYLIEVRAPISNDTWRLSGDDAQAQLDGVGAQPLRDRDPQALLERELGWHLPVLAARDWVRGLAHDRLGARIEYDDDGLPRRMTELGWTVEYRGWYEPVAGAPALPKRVFATRSPYQVRLAIAAWAEDDAR